MKLSELMIKTDGIELGLQRGGGSHQSGRARRLRPGETLLDPGAVGRAEPQIPGRVP